jgi:hypothetical protein
MHRKSIHHLFGFPLLMDGHIRDTVSPSSSEFTSLHTHDGSLTPLFAFRMKALLFTLVRAFEFELAVPASDIGKKTSVVQRPIVRSEPAAGNQMPLLIKSYVRS